MEHSPSLMYLVECTEGAPQYLCKRDIVSHDLPMEGGTEKHAMRAHLKRHAEAPCVCT